MAQRTAKALMYASKTDMQSQGNWSLKGTQSGELKSLNVDTKATKSLTARQMKRADLKLLNY